MKAINRNQLFAASCLSLLVTSLSFGICAGILNLLGVRFHLNSSQSETISAIALCSFLLAIITRGTGKHYAQLIEAMLPEGLEMSAYSNAKAESKPADTFNKAKKTGRLLIINITLMIPIFLITAFKGLSVGMRSYERKEVLLTA